MISQPEPSVSIIVPVYNGALYLYECLESVLAQTYHNWTCTIVNNCSSDSTLEIAHGYAAKDARIRIYNNLEFLRVVANHNNALRQMGPESKYCKLLFADDWLFPSCLESMVALAEAHPSVGIVASYGLRDSAVLWAGLPYKDAVISGREVCRQRLQGGPYIFGTGTSQLFRADLVRSRDPFYNESNLHCDSEVCFQILEASDFGFIHQILHYTRAPGAESLTTIAYGLHTLEAMTLYELMTYGPVYLTKEELHYHLNKKFADYYGFLARSILEGGNSWGFHKKKIREFGLTLDRTRLAGAILKKGVNAVLRHPRKTIEQIWNGTSILSRRLRFWRATRQDAA